MIDREWIDAWYTDLLAVRCALENDHQIEDGRAMDYLETILDTMRHTLKETKP